MFWSILVLIIPQVFLCVINYCSVFVFWQKTNICRQLLLHFDVLPEPWKYLPKETLASCNCATQSVFICLKSTMETSEKCEIRSKLTGKMWNNVKYVRRQWRGSGVFIVNFEHISHIVLVFSLLTLNKLISADHVISFQRRVDLQDYVIRSKIRRMLLEGLVEVRKMYCLSTKERSV